MAKPPSAKAAALLGLIQASTEPSALHTTPPPLPPAPPSALTPAPAATAASRSSRKGKRVTIFLHEGDRRIIRELMAFLAGQGRRVSESITIKAALRMAKPGNDFLIAHQDAAAQDQRFKASGQAESA